MKKHILTIIVSSIAGILLLAMVGKKIFTSPYKLSAQEQLELMINPEVSYSLFELAVAIKANDPSVLLIDLRDEEHYKQGSLPNAINVPMDKLFDEVYAEYIEGRSDKVKVLFASSETEAIRVNALLMLNEYAGFKVLDASFDIANTYVVKKPTPSYYHFSDEKMRHNYSTLMPNGANSSQPANEEVVIDMSTPRGGC